MNLKSLGYIHQTDKATYHEYLDFYESNLDKNNIWKFLEIGVQGGNSHAMWREWLMPGAQIEGWDIFPQVQVAGVDIRQVDQTNRDQMRANITGIYDVILDDGAHTVESIETSFGFLFPHTKIYIIEDLHAPWCGPDYMKENEVPTLEKLEKFLTNGWQSNYNIPQEQDYINKNLEILDIFVRGERTNPLSSTAILINKENAL
ncbi:MAG: hypothetical protein ACO295_05320 [Sediminibacterium sp.]